MRAVGCFVGTRPLRFRSLRVLTAAVPPVVLCVACAVRCVQSGGEPKKEEFQRYLEKSGVIDAMTKVLVGLYEVPEKPANAIDFIKEYLGASVSVDLDKLKSTIDSQAKLIEEKDKEIAALKKQLEAVNAPTQ